MKKFLCIISIILSVIAIVGAVYALTSRKEVIYLNEVE